MSVSITGGSGGGSSGGGGGGVGVRGGSKTEGGRGVFFKTAIVTRALATSTGFGGKPAIMPLTTTFFGLLESGVVERALEGVSDLSAAGAIGGGFAGSPALAIDDKLILELFGDNF